MARTACPYRKSNPDVLMVQTSEMRDGHDAANRLSYTRTGADPILFCVLENSQDPPHNRFDRS